MPKPSTQPVQSEPPGQVDGQIFTHTNHKKKRKRSDKKIDKHRERAWQAKAVKGEINFAVGKPFFLPRQTQIKKNE